MRALYQPVFSFEVLHSYFSNGRCNYLEFIPTNETKGLMANGGLIYAAFDDQLNIVLDKHRIDALLLILKDNDGALMLDFKVFTNSNLGSCSQLPLHSLETQLHFSYQYPSSNFSKNNNSIIIHQGKWVSEADYVNHSTIACSGLLASKKDVMNNFSFSLSLMLTEKMINDMSNGGTFECESLAICFQAPVNIWKYYVMSPQIYSELFIVDVNNNITFESKGSQLMSNGDMAMTFMSKTPLNVVQRSNYHFQLRSKNENITTTLVKRLPVAAVSNILKSIVNGNATAISEIYVNY